MDAKFTPGPWELIADRGRPRMAIVRTSAGKMAIDATDSGNSPSEDEANARLIAAAPELLEQAQIALRYLNESEIIVGNRGIPYPSGLKAAIEKATR